MSEWDRLHQMAEYYKAEYPSGTRIMLLSMGEDGKPYLKWHCGQDVMDWWLSENSHSVPENQITFEDISAEGVEKQAGESEVGCVATLSRFTAPGNAGRVGISRAFDHVIFRVGC